MYFTLSMIFFCELSCILVCSYCARSNSSTWSQCVDCTNFDNSCEYWDADVLAAASEACQENCPTMRCDNVTAPCYGGDVCVTATDGSWAQCVDCDQPDFQDTCVVWSTSLRAAAVHVCDENCLNTRCTVDDSGMECVGGFTCVVQADGGWSQCIGEWASRSCT